VKSGARFSTNAFAASRCHAPGRDKRDPKLLGDTRQQDHVWDIVLARMAAAFKAVDAYRVTADPRSRQRMANRGAFMNDLDPVRL
jgi:hypothetical protein